jgi:protein-tyrosine-phosphatase
MTTPPLSVLFLCTGNSARSQMAEAILKHLAGGRAVVESAGTAPQPEIHPMARHAVTTLLNLDMGAQHPKVLDRFLGRHFDYVITECDREAET